MLLAVDTMDPTLVWIFYAIALICFVGAAVGYVWGKVSLIGLGLAFYIFPTFWNALARA